MMITTTTFTKRLLEIYFRNLYALFFCFLLFQAAANAQNPSDTPVKQVSITGTEWMIKSTTTDQELDEYLNAVNNDFALKLKFKKVARNENNEINTIKVVLSDDKGTKRVYNVSEEEPIKPFTIFVRSQERNVIDFDFGDASSILLVQENLKNQRHADSISNLEKKVAATSEVKAASEKNTSDESGSGSDDISLIKKDKELDYTKAFISLNGKEISAVELDKIDPKTIGSVRKVNSLNNDNLIRQYGEKARYGLILIETMYILKPLTSSEIEALPENFKLEAENGAFIIDKNSQDSDIEFYRKQLAQIGVTLETEKLERRAEGSIININIKLHDDTNNVVMKNWIPFKNANGINNIYIGRKNGKVTVATR